MNEKHLFPRPFFHPNLTWPLRIIIAYLFIIAIGNILATYNNLVIARNITAGIGTLLSAFLFVIPAFGLLKLKQWARLMEITLALLTVIFGMLLMAAGNWGIGAFLVILHALIAIYLLSNHCRKAFGFVVK